MKKFYEAPVVELNGFSVEDVITTSVPEITTANVADFAAAVEANYGANSYSMVDYAGTSGSYNW